mmetsp:Transcript_121564/g.223943  ORF Transcript_121564/g.223943 Transcript_121564/m.223943 type:complete len:412 (+) Transcript_121564:43-1278(+)
MKRKRSADQDGGISDQVRSAAVGLLLKSLEGTSSTQARSESRQGAPSRPAVPADATVPLRDVASAIERAVLAVVNESQAYRAKVRSLAATLRRNVEVQHRVRHGELSADELVQAEDEALLTREQREKLHQHRQESLALSLNSNLGQYVLGIDCTGADCHEECERRHLEEREQARSTWTKLARSELIICAGPERSGSTWLYNAVRLLHLASSIPCDSYWLAALTEDALRERMEAQPFAMVLVKTHDWHAGYPDLLRGSAVFPGAKHIILTHRNLSGVCASYRRVKWEIGIQDRYVQDHMQWRKLSTLDLAYEEIVSQGERSLQKLAHHLGLNLAAKEIAAVNAELLELRRCHLGSPVCQVTKLWPNHMSSATRKLQGQAHAKDADLNRLLDPAYVEVLNSRFREYQEVYGYI